MNISRVLRTLLSGLLVVGLVFTLAFDADAAAKKKKKKAREKNYILSESTAKKMIKMGELAQDDDFTGALEILDSLAKRRKLRNHDRAVVFQNRALMLAALERYPESAESFETALEQNALPISTTQSIQYNLAQLYMAIEKYKEAARLLEKWFETAENPGGQAHFLLCAAYAQQDMFDKALPHARAAVKKDKSPVEQHLGLLLATEFQNGNLVETLAVLKVLTTQFPRKNYYLQLAYGYANAGEELKALATLQLAHTQGWLQKNDELVNFAQRYLYHELPWRAAQVLKKGLEDEIIEPSADNFELYANTLLAARNYQEALEPLTKAAELAEDGDLFVRLAQVYLEVENWPAARRALDNAIKKGQLRDPGNAQLLLGISNFNEKRFKSAKVAFKRALKEKKVRDSATKWLKHVDRELDKIEFLGE